MKECIIEAVEISNPNKTLFKNPNVTKKELALYYQKVSKKMLPYLENRIISTIRCPNGVSNKCFFKKHVGLHNKGIKTINIPSENNNKEDYYYITNISGIISEVQLNTIEFHTWGSTVKNLNKPDIMVFDLDPDEGVGIEKVREGAKDLKSILDELSLKSFLKTSGGKGYHIVIPFVPSVDWQKFRKFAKDIATLMEEKWPKKYTSNVRKENRKNKIFVDWIRNTKGASCVAPYSVRSKKKATISMPIFWEELNKITPDSIKMQDAIDRLSGKNPWKDFFKINQKIV